MREPPTIPPNEITGADLRPWHVVTIECGGCGHGRVVDHRWLQRGSRAAKTLDRLNWRCEYCGKTSAEVRHVIRVVKLPRNV